MWKTSLLTALFDDPPAWRGYRRFGSRLPCHRNFNFRSPHISMCKFGYVHANPTAERYVGVEHVARGRCGESED